ncbi:hypothetical protein VFPPC_17468 [Pochonia chlamydosporia 170]|uniref:Uncharacterized protein n=1 Tax=Pochonia chlamydosporia 170 TaxID=1380566 RepID=A0A219ARZ9_METCM|nr:hypothetical protein VFPPC_17468 [Pochonia chlamydosporia 170]OWT43369.1 hypothetical protein VFPPC_17468 [Pochonia chlamydosporia 170]
MSAAARLRRLDESATITVFGEGPYVGNANCGIPYTLSSVIIDDVWFCTLRNTSKSVLTLTFILTLKFLRLVVQTSKSQFRPEEVNLVTLNMTSFYFPKAQAQSGLELNEKPRTMSSPCGRCQTM